MFEKLILAVFQGYTLEQNPSSPFFVLRDRADGPVIQGDTRGDLFHEALDAIDEYHATGIRGAFSPGDFEAMDRMINWISDDQSHRVDVRFQRERAA